MPASAPAPASASASASCWLSTRLHEHEHGHKHGHGHCHGHGHKHGHGHGRGHGHGHGHGQHTPPHTSKASFSIGGWRPTRSRLLCFAARTPFPVAVVALSKRDAANDIAATLAGETLKKPRLGFGLWSLSIRPMKRARPRQTHSRSRFSSVFSSRVINTNQEKTRRTPPFGAVRGGTYMHQRGARTQPQMQHTTQTPACKG